ncbi:ADCY6 cyclase, partial [Pteruthius melanotis]|nr:ADCY6 cyclase [Pteruthius melanotis]
AQEALNPEDEVDEFLSRAIDARSIDQLRKDHVKKFLLTFQTPELEKKVGGPLSPLFWTHGPVCLLKSPLSWPCHPLCPSISPPSHPSSPRWFHGSSTSPVPLHSIPSLGVTSVPSHPLGVPHVSSHPLQSPPSHSLHPLGSLPSTSIPCPRMLLSPSSPCSGLNVTPGAVGPCQLRALNFSLGTPVGSCHGHGLACDFPEYFSYSVVLSLLACSVFLHISSIGKLLLMVGIEATFLLLVEGPHAALFDNADLLVVANALGGEGGQEQQCLLGVCAAALGGGYSLGVSGVGSALGSACKFGACLGGSRVGLCPQATGEKEEMEELQAYNRRLLHNILPKDVAAHFLARERRNDELYYQSCECVAVMFASISNFSEFYVELEANNEGVECLRLLNEIIADFDEVLGRRR